MILCGEPGVLDREGTRDDLSGRRYSPVHHPKAFPYYFQVALSQDVGTAVVKEVKGDNLRFRLFLAMICLTRTSQAVKAEETARAFHETWQMSAADIAGHHRDLMVHFLLACEKSREALAFSWRSVQQMEDRDAEDWTQVTLRFAIVL